MKYAISSLLLTFMVHYPARVLLQEARRPDSKSGNWWLDMLYVPRPDIISRCSNFSFDIAKVVMIESESLLTVVLFRGALFSRLQKKIVFLKKRY